MLMNNWQSAIIALFTFLLNCFMPLNHMRFYKSRMATILISLEKKTLQLWDVFNMLLFLSITFWFSLQYMGLHVFNWPISL